MQSYIKEFTDYLTVDKGYARNTILSYKSDLKHFMRFFENEKLKNLNDVDFRFMVSFLSELQMLQYAPSSRRRILECIKSFFKFLKKEQYISVNKIKYMEGPKLWEKLPRILSVDEVDYLIQQTDSTSFHKTNLRNRAILELLYGSGLRVSELNGLKVKDINGDFIWVNGKGSKQRLVPITKRFQNALLLYWKEKRNKLKYNDFVFVSRSNLFLDRIAIWSMLKRCSNLAGFEQNIHPHILRHSFASHLLNNGASIRVIQEILGHSDIGTTGRYLHLSIKNLNEKFIKHHPRYDVSIENKVIPLIA